MFAPKKKTLMFAALAVALVMIASALPAAIATHTGNGNGKGVGDHEWKFNVIGRPNDYNGAGDDSNGNTLFVSLVSEKKGKSNGQEFVCEDASFYEDEPADNEPFYELLDGKERIRFSTGDDYAMIDRDATDGWAEIQVPEYVTELHVAVRVLGKPGGCADFDGIAEDTCIDETTGEEIECFWWSGTIHANRKKGAPEKVEVSDIFLVTGDFDGDGVISEDEIDVSVFEEEFEGYFWEVTNDGLKLMQVIFYLAE